MLVKTEHMKEVYAQVRQRGGWLEIHKKSLLSLFSPLFCCSGFAVGIYTTNSPEACQYVADNCKANIIVVENHKQLQKILQVRSESTIIRDDRD